MRKPVFNLILLLLLIINTIIFLIQFNSLIFVNKIIPIIINVILIIILVASIYLIYRSMQGNFKNQMLILIVSILLNLILIVFNIGTNVFDKLMSKITNNDVMYSSTIIVRSDSNIHSISDLDNVKIGISDNEEDYENYKLCFEYLKKNKKLESNTFYKYTNYLLAINDLLESKIDALVISSNYATLYREYFDSLDNKVSMIIKPISVYDKKENKKSVDTEKPFTILLIGADGNGGETYNADVLILMTVNPNTKKVVMVDVVRDTYAYNIGAQMMDKITHSGWYGNENVVQTVSNLFNINIDYYIKMNFTSVVGFVDLIGGIEMEVPYRYHVDQNGKVLYYVDPGIKRLNGTETLWLARTRQAPGSSLISRGKMQMNIIEAVSKQVDSKTLIKNFFSITDILGDNIKTNISKENLYYYIQKYASIKGDMVFSHNTLDGVDSNYYHPGMKRQLYTYKYKEESLSELEKMLKDNLKA